MENRNFTDEEIKEILSLRPPKKSLFGKFIERTFNNLGTTVTGISLHYDLIINGVITRDYVMLGKGTISVLALCFCEDPKFSSQENLNPQTTI
jgi:hypothetical protein